jgi:hypothetical protein
VFAPIDNTLEERLEVRLGDRYRPGVLPPDLELEGPWGRYHARSTWTGDELHLDRALVLRPFWLEAERWPEFVEFCRQVALREEARIPLEVVSP